MRESSTAETLARADVPVPDATRAADRNGVARGRVARDGAVRDGAARNGAVRDRSVATGPLRAVAPPTTVSSGGAVSEGVARPVLDVVDDALASLVLALRHASGTLGRLAATAPAVTTDAFTVRARVVCGAESAVLTSIDARRSVLTTRDADGAIAAWLVDDGAIAARLPPGVSTALGGVTVTVNEGERALVVAHERRSRHAGAVLALALDLSMLDARDAHLVSWLGRRRSGSSARLRRHVLTTGRAAPVTRPPRSAGPMSRGQAGDVAVPPGMSRADAACLDAVRRAFARGRVGRVGGLVDTMPERALAGVGAFLAAASARFLEGREGATRVLDASPVLYGVLVRYHGVSYVTRTPSASS